MNPDLDDFSSNQIQRITIPTYSENEWAISVPSLDTLVTLLQNPDYMFFITVSWYFNRENPRDSAYSQGLNAKILSQTERNILNTMLRTTGVETSLDVTSKNLFF